MPNFERALAVAQSMDVLSLRGVVNFANYDAFKSPVLGQGLLKALVIYILDELVQNAPGEIISGFSGVFSHLMGCGATVGELRGLEFSFDSDSQREALGMVRTQCEMHGHC